MTSQIIEVAEQILDEITATADRLWSLGLHFADPNDPAASSQIAAQAQVLAAQLAQDDDDRLSAQTCIDLMVALWPHGAPEDVGQPEWWRTALGRLCARSLGRSDAEAVTYAVAAAMLGIARGTVGVMVTRGTLDKHPDGGVLRASVLQRLGRR